MSRVFWDSNLFIYMLEENPQYIDRMKNLRRAHYRRKDIIVTSWMTVAEIQVKPRQLGQQALCGTYRDMLKSTTELVSFDEKAAESFLYIRTQTRIKSPDAIQLACAAAANVEMFITNDINLSDLTLPGIDFIVPLDRVPF